MFLTRISIRAPLAHFKIPARSKIQKTYEIPPISSVVGILQNFYGKDINNFKFGYFIKFDSKHNDLMTIYKELNLNKRRITDKDRFKSEVCIVEYLTNIELVIYTDINKEILLNDVLVAGKANCLATIQDIKKVELLEQAGFGYNQYTDIKIGQGQIRRINTITKYNENTDMYDIKMALVRENIEFEYDKYYDYDYDQNIYIWKWENGEIYGVR